MFLQVSKSAPLATKDVDDVLGGKDAWKNVDQTSGALYCVLLCQWKHPTQLIFRSSSQLCAPRAATGMPIICKSKSAPQMNQ